MVTEEGELAALRNEGARRAKGSILVFIDDDVVCERTWLEEIVKTFDSKPDIGGVSGPSIVDDYHRSNRDIFKNKVVKKLYDWFFLEGMENLPGRITRSGTWTTGACNDSCDFNGPVDYLEACNMSFRREAFETVGGFDESYKGVGDWSEPDLAFRIKQLGYDLWFNNRVRLNHNPSRSGAFKKRGKDSPNRLKNYYLFADRWVEPHWRNNIYKLFLRIYYEIKSFKR